MVTLLAAQPRPPSLFWTDAQADKQDGILDDLKAAEGAAGTANSSQPRRDRVTVHPAQKRTPSPDSAYQPFPPLAKTAGCPDRIEARASDSRPLDRCQARHLRAGQGTPNDG